MRSADMLWTSAITRLRELNFEAIGVVKRQVVCIARQLLVTLRELYLRAKSYSCAISKTTFVLCRRNKRHVISLLVGVICVIPVPIFLVMEHEEIEETTIYFGVHSDSNEQVTAHVELYPNGNGQIRFRVSSTKNREKQITDHERVCIELSTNRHPTNVTFGRTGKSYGPAEDGACADVDGGLSLELQHFTADAIENRGPWILVEQEAIVVRTVTGHVGILDIHVSDEDEKPLPLSVTLKAPSNFSVSESFPRPHTIQIDSPRTQETTEKFGGPPFEYDFGATNGKFLSKWEFIDSTAIHNREILLLMLSALLGVGVTLIVGTIVRFGSKASDNS